MKGHISFHQKCIASRNLLDNSDFTDPVNQRGATSYAASGQPTIDRWVMVGDGSLNVADGYVSLVKKSGDDVDIQQNLENYDRMKGKTYTIAVGNIDGRTYAAPFVMGKVVTGIALGGCTFYSVDNRNILFRVTESDGWYWAALYEGVYTADMLPPYVPKGYATELAECKRYYQHIVRIAYCYAVSDNVGYYVIDDFPEMRIAPTVTASILHNGLGTNDYAPVVNMMFTNRIDYISSRVLLEANRSAVYDCYLSADL